MSTTAAPPEAEAVRCLEIRGGSGAVEQALDLPGLDAYVASAPHEGADRGGDLHYVSVCGGGATVRAIVADVSGHGAAVADFSAALRGILRKHIADGNQARLVRSLSREFGAAAELRRFATAVVLTYQPHGRELSVCNAGHPRPLHYRAASGSWSVLVPEVDGAANLPLGIDDEAAYESFALPIAAGDLLVLYTDALTEAADPSGRMLGEAGLIGLAAPLDTADPRRFGRALLDAVAAHRGGTPADDDVTLVVLRSNGGGSRFPGPLEFPLVVAKMFGLARVVRE